MTSATSEQPEIIPRWVENLREKGVGSEEGQYYGKTVREGFPLPCNIARIRQFFQELTDLWDKSIELAQQVEQLTRERDAAIAQSESDLQKNIHLTEQLRLEEENTTILGAELRNRTVVPVDVQVRADEIQRQLHAAFPPGSIPKNPPGFFLPKGP
jgi:vacuolar-type H+-ATPase subunit I/STV1